MFSFFLMQGTVILLFGNPNGLLDHANKKPVASWCMASGYIFGYIFTLVMRGSRKGEERADPKDPDPIPWISWISSIQKKKTKKTNKEKKNPDKQTKQNTRK